MFELSIACKYLRPRWRQLSVSIISLISILVIALVVWLIVVFFSVTTGLEKRWVEKLIALTAPLRITPTEAYYNSYYYQIDSISENSDYSLKTIGEKVKAAQSDPYDPENDVEVPVEWTKADRESDGALRDPVKKAFYIVQNLPGYPGLKAKDYEASTGNLRLRLLRKANDGSSALTQAFLTQSTYLASLDNENPALLKAIIPISSDDIHNLFNALSFDTNREQEDNPNSANRVNDQVLKKRLKAFYDYIQLADLKTKETLPSGPLVITKGDIQTQFNHIPQPSPFWFYQVTDGKHQQVFLPTDLDLGEGILLPKPFKEAGVLLGDRGYISFQTPTASAMQEQRIKVFVAGFYDQGLIPIGGKFILVNHTLTNLIAGAHHTGQTQSNGINVRFADLNHVDKIKTHLLQAFNQAGIAPYWKVETYREYEFTKDIIQQLSSDKHLFTLIAAVIIVVACSNVISMLIILVNDKKLEIGILRSMGASSLSIATIFGLCGAIMGVTGSVIGIAAAIVTLNNLDLLVHLLSSLQGHQAFNPLYYGDSLPNEINVQVLLYVMTATAVVSLISGLVPALKASLLRPSSILRAE